MMCAPEYLDVMISKYVGIFKHLAGSRGKCALFSGFSSYVLEYHSYGLVFCLTLNNKTQLN